MLKQQRNVRRLVLAKQTIRVLNDQLLANAAGGIPKAPTDACTTHTTGAQCTGGCTADTVNCSGQ